MSILGSMKNRLAVNLKVTRLSFMTQPNDILVYCQQLAPDERKGAIRAIESMFRWQPVAEMAQSIFPGFHGGSGVSAEALDMVTHGQVAGGIELMRYQNQTMPPAAVGGMLPIQQVALSFAWTVLKAMEASSNADQNSPPSGQSDLYCTGCGQQRASGARYCVRCGKAFRQ